MNPEQMREQAVVNEEFAEASEREGLITDMRLGRQNAAALRAAADQLEAVHGMLQTTDPGNPYMYDPWSDESVDPTNMDEVVRAAVSAGWSKGAYELTRSIREALESEKAAVL